MNDIFNVKRKKKIENFKPSESLNFICSENIPQNNVK